MRLVHLRRDALLPALDFARALLIGTCIGLLSCAFRISVEWCQSHLTVWHTAVRLAWSGGSYLPFALFALTLATTLTTTAWLVLRFAPEAAGSGVQEVEAALSDARSFRPVRLLVFKFFGGIVALGSGLALGREGPTIQMGAALGDLLSPKERRATSLAAGAAAGLAAAFNAPISALLLIIEEMRGQFKFSSRALQFVLIATLCADIVTRSLLGNSPIIGLHSYHPPQLNSTWMFVALGFACGLIGWVFNHSLLYVLDHYSPRRTGMLLPIGWGLIAAVALIFFPDSMGDGYSLIPDAVSGDIAASALWVLILLRLATAVGSFGTGVPGGVFAPLVSLGILVGCGFGPLARMWIPSVTNLQLALAAVGGLFAATIQAPLTGIVLAIELTGELDASLSLLVAAVAASAVARTTRSPALYVALGRRLPRLSRQQESTFV